MACHFVNGHGAALAAAGLFAQARHTVVTAIA